MTESSEERAGGLGAVSPLLGTRAAQSAVDALARNVERLNTSLSKAVTSLQRTGNGSGGGKGWNGGSNFGHGKPIGGGSAYKPGDHWDNTFLGGGNGGGPTGLGPRQSGTAGNGGWGRAASFGATAMVAAGVGNMSNYVSANTTAQMLSRNSATSWSTIRGSFNRNNYTATSMQDAAQAGATLGTLGYAAGSSRWNAAAGYNRNFGLVDPSMSASQVANAQAGLTTPGMYNYMQGRGISTIGAGGRVMDPGQLTNSMLQRVGNVRDINRFMGATGGFQNIATSLRMQGASEDTIQALTAESRAQLTAKSKGFSYQQYRTALDKNDTKSLEKMGINTTDATRLKVTAAKQRNVEDNMADGFSKGLDHATDALQTFADALNKATSGPLGHAIGYGQGLGGGLASGGGSALGGFLGSKMAGKIGKNVLSKGLPRVAGMGGTGSAAAAEGGSSALASGAGAAGMGVAAVGAGVALPFLVAAKYSDGYVMGSTPKNLGNYGDLNRAGSGSFAMPSSLGGGKSLLGTDGISGGASSQGGGSGGSGAGKAGGAAPSSGGATAAKVISIAMRFIGVPYKWGGTTPKGFDCSGLMQYSFGKAGVSLPRVSQAQMRVGSAVRMSEVRPGDLVFPADGHHVAMVIGPGKIIEAPRTGLNVRVTGLRSSFTVARRVLSSVGSVGAVTGDSASSVSGDNRNQGAMPGPGGNAGAGGASTSEADNVAAALGGSAGALSIGASKKDSGADAASTSNGASSSAGGAPSGNVGSWIKSALGILHLDANKYGKALGTIIQHESGGNPKAINKWDSNWKAGHPSKGIMQTIDSTFNAYKLPGHGNIWNPVDNIIAATRYALSRYGSMDNVPGIKSLNNGGAYKGYAVGSTNIDVDQIAKVHKGEMVLDAGNAEKVREALSGNTPTKGMFGGGGGKVVLQFNDGSIRLHASGPMNDSAATDFAKQFVNILANNTELQTIAAGN